MKKSYIADSILNEYYKKKRYEANKTRAEMNMFIKEVCSKCKNRKYNVCSIRRNINGDLQCIFKEL